MSPAASSVVALVTHARQVAALERERFATRLRDERLGRDVDGRDEQAIRDIFAL